MSATSDIGSRRSRREAKRRRIITTPEGVELPVRIAEAGQRFAAFLIDLFIMGVAIVAGVFLVVKIGGDLLPTGWMLSAVLLLFFAVRGFYFMFFELSWQGRTPGKRAIGLRVIDRRGGPLRADAVVVRNLMREVEVFMPLNLVIVGGVRGADGLTELFLWGWTLILLLLPLFNRDRLRAGDMVGGTMVVSAPKAMLMPDLVQAPARGSVPSAGQPAGPAAETKIAPEAPAYQFTEAQLGVYGVYELQILEDVLRTTSQHAGEREIARRIQRKINWQGPVADDRAFLSAFYTALRAHLERRMLFGRRRESKHDAD